MQAEYQISIFYSSKNIVKVKVDDKQDKNNMLQIIGSRGKKIHIYEYKLMILYMYLAAFYVSGRPSVPLYVVWMVQGASSCGQWYQTFLMPWINHKSKK